MYIKYFTSINVEENVYLSRYVTSPIIIIASGRNKMLLAFMRIQSNEMDDS